jgi:hypothetical protein
MCLCSLCAEHHVGAFNALSHLALQNLHEISHSLLLNEEGKAYRGWLLTSLAMTSSTW